MGRIIDISQPVDPSIGVWPGDSPFVSEFTWDMAHGGRLRLDMLRQPYPSAFGDNANYLAAGGSLTDRFGNPTHEHETAISTNRLLHEIVLAELRT